MNNNIHNNSINTHISSNDNININNNQGLYGSLYNDFMPYKNLSDTINLPDPPTLLRFKSNPVLPVAQPSNATSRIEGSYLKTYELNNQLPTPMNSFVESIYPLSELSNDIIHDISSFQLQPSPSSAPIFSPYAESNLPLSRHMDVVESPPEPTKKFETEANNLTRRIIEGNLKSDHSDEYSSNRLLHKQNITCVEDLISKRRPRVKKPKIAKRAYRRRVLKPSKEVNTVTKQTPTSSPIINVIDKAVASLIQTSNLTTPSDLKFDLGSTDNINFDNIFGTSLMESPEFKDSSPNILDTPLDEFVNGDSIPSSQDITLQLPSSTTSSSFPLTDIDTTTPINRTFDITEQKAPSPKCNDILLTPSSANEHLSLVDQIKYDKFLFEVISKKQKRGSYKCAHCPETFPNILDYAAHMDNFGIKREFKCPFVLCPWKVLGFPKRSDLRRHCAFQHKDELKSELKDLLNLKDEAFPTILCSNKYCEKEFYRKDAFARHVAIVHQNKKSRFNKKLAALIQDYPENLTEEEKVEYIKVNINKTRLNNKQKS